MASARRWSVDGELRALGLACQVRAAEHDLAAARDAARRALDACRPRIERQQRLQDLRQRILGLEARIAHQRRLVHLQRKKLEGAVAFLDIRRNARAQAEHKLTEEVSWLESNLEVIARNRDALYQLLRDTYQEQARIAFALLFIFPIETLDRKSYTIRSVPLPNSDYEERHDSIAVSAALGWIVYILQLLADLLQFPNRYHLTSLGSRSTIQDPVSGQVYPLYEEKTSPFTFEYGVFLLNNCLGEMLEARGIAVSSLQMTLANLKMLLESVAQGGSNNGPGIDASSNHTSPFVGPTSATLTSFLGPFSASAHSPSLLHLPRALSLARSPTSSVTFSTDQVAGPLTSPTQPQPTQVSRPMTPTQSGRVVPLKASRRTISGSSQAMLLVTPSSPSSPGLAPAGGGGGVGGTTPSGSTVAMNSAGMLTPPMVRSSAAARRRAEIAQSGEWRVVNGQLKLIDGVGRGGS